MEDATPTCPDFVRGTTPQFRYTLTDSNGDPLDLTEFTTLKVTIAQIVEGYKQGNRITLHDADISVDGNVISFALTEAESLLFQPGYVALQVYGKSEKASSWSTLAEDVSIQVRKSLKDGDAVEHPGGPPGTGSSTFTIGDETVTGTLTVDHVTYSGGTNDYEKFINKPALQYGDIRKELVGTLTMSDFGLREESVQPLTNSDIDNLVRGKF